ncbi:hypothetical protein [Thermostilla marina]
MSGKHVFCLLLLFVFSTTSACSRYSEKPRESTDEVAPLEPAASPVIPVQERTPPPARPDIELAEISAVELRAGERTEVPLAVDRHGRKGRITISVEGLPEGISAKGTIPGSEDEGTLVLEAAPDANELPEEINLICRASLGDSTASQPFRVRIRQTPPPKLEPPEVVVLSPGTEKLVPISVAFQGAPSPIRFDPSEVPDGWKESSVECGVDGKVAIPVAVPSNAEDGTHQLVYAVTTGNHRTTLALTIRVVRRPFTFDSFRVVRLSPGESATVTIPVVRNGYGGPIDVALENLPEGVEASCDEVPAGGKELVLTFTASRSAEPRVRSTYLVGSGGIFHCKSPIIVRVVDQQGDYLPPELVSSQEMRMLFRRGSIGARLSANSKNLLADVYGGTPESEAAVQAGLRWLAAHQSADGHWSLNHYDQATSDCDCKTDFEAEVIDMDTAGTALGLLPFLGAGITHVSAPEGQSELLVYRTTVRYGLSWLMRHQVSSRDLLKDGNLGGSMYAHALGTMVLCEAYGLTGDERIAEAARRAIRYLMAAQHQAGGWRYQPRQAGDMSVVGWVFLAIREGQLAGLPIDKSPLLRAENFLDACSVGEPPHEKAQYCYQPGGAPKPSLTAAGILARQYLGWPKDHPDLEAACELIFRQIPPQEKETIGPLYFYYYATQVLHHMEGDRFDLWNHRMRELLVRTQERNGHRAGSWSPQGVDHGAKGGRLYSTSLALMTLEVYYRHLPMYRPIRRGSLAAQPSPATGR